VDPGLKNFTSDTVEEKKQEPQREKEAASSDLTFITQRAQTMDRTGGHEIDQT
jgi:hypothetical protein